MRCEVGGNPRPAVFWNKATSQILMFPRQNHGRYSVADSGTLTINPVRKEDAGEYECQALSVAGSAVAKSTIEVRGMLYDCRDKIFLFVICVRFYNTRERYIKLKV